MIEFTFQQLGTLRRVRVQAHTLQHAKRLVAPRLHNAIYIGQRPARH